MSFLNDVAAVAFRAAAVALGVVVTTFVLLTVVPGDVATVMLAGRATPERLAALRSQFGLDHPWPQRMLDYLVGLFTGGGTSFASGQPVASLIVAHIGPTITIVGLALIFAVAMSVPIALVAALHHNRLADQTMRIITAGGVAIPSFLLGMILILIFGVELRWLPVGGTQAGLGSYILPAFTAALGVVPVVARSLRVQLLDVAGADYIAAARAAGFANSRVTFAYLLPNAAVPAITLIGLNIAYLFGGTFIVEKVFAIRGLGSLMFDAIRDRDVPVVQGVVLVTAVAVVLTNVVTELTVRLIDPRRRTKGR